MKVLIMETFQENIKEYRKQLKKGAIKEAYKGLMGYIMDLRTYFKTIAMFENTKNPVNSDRCINDISNGKRF
jgi:hypothetical protein